MGREAAKWLLLTLVAATAPAGQVGAAATNQPAGQPLNPTVYSEKIRQECIAGRRIVCGRIVKILPEGLVVDSGYPSLRREALRGKWLIRGTVAAQRDPGLVEGREPDAMCAGYVLLSDFPKSRRMRPKLYDYVVIEGFPAGEFTYTPVGKLHRTVRRFSAVLEEAVKMDRLL